MYRPSVYLTSLHMTPRICILQTSEVGMAWEQGYIRKRMEFAEHVSRSKLLKYHHAELEIKTVNSHILQWLHMLTLYCHKICKCVCYAPPLPHGLITLGSRRSSHIHTTCRSVCDWDQNGIKRSTFFLEAYEGIKTNSKKLMSAQILRRCGYIFPLWTPVLS